MLYIRLIGINMKKPKHLKKKSKRIRKKVKQLYPSSLSSISLKKGCLCRLCSKGRLFQLKPGTNLRIVGQPWLQMEIYRPERFRCNLCGKIFTAKLPMEFAINSRADASAKAIVSLLKYRAGLPFYRQGQI